MAKMSRRKKGQQKVLEEIKKQLLLQAERWGKKDYYTPFKLEEMVLDQSYKIRGDFLTEKANLEYELQSVGANKRECLIKLEKIQSYIKKAEQMIHFHDREILRGLARLVGDPRIVGMAVNRFLKNSKISILIGKN